jgi:Mrp family chromosome partitioning ATPase
MKHPEPTFLPAAFEGVRLRLLAAGLLSSAERSNTLAMTSIHRGEGVSTVAIGTAAALALQDEGGVLLVDGTPLGQRSAALLGLAAAPWLASNELSSLEQHIQRAPAVGVDVLQLAAPPPPAGESPAAQAWAALWQTLQGRYRQVVVDAGCLRADAPHRWAGWVNHTVLVIDTTRVTRETLVSFRRELRHAGPPLAGFVLNKRKFHVPARIYRALS